MSGALDISTIKDIYKLKQLIAKSRVWQNNIDETIAEIEAQIVLMERKKVRLQRELKYAKRRKDSVIASNNNRVSEYQSAINEHKPRIREIQRLLRNKVTDVFEGIQKEAESANKQLSEQALKMIDEVNENVEVIESIQSVSRRTAQLCKLKAREYLNFTKKITETKQLLNDAQDAKYLIDLLGDLINTYPPEKIQSILLEIY
jgi:hypothetical protein